MRNLGYTLVYIFMICTLVSESVYAQLDCSSLPAPPNDQCADAIDIVNSISGTTCCAAIETLDQCGSMGSGVWYKYVPQDNGSLVDVINTGINGPIGVEFYSGDCGNLSLIKKSNCAGFDDRTFLISNCYDEVYIHVTSTKDGCGTFDIVINTSNNCIFAEECDDISPAVTFNPVSDGNQECITSCLQFACNSECTDQGVWFQVNTDNDASAIQISIENAQFNPLISVYRGNNCGDTEDLIICQDLTVDEFINLDVISNFTYFIEISSSGGLASGFDLCVSSVKDFVDCSSGTLTVSRPAFPMENPEGPYCPGETVVFCYEIEYYVDVPGTGNNCQWLQGIIPVIGGGWDQSVNSLASQAPASWIWLDEGSVDYNVPSEVLSIANNSNGDLILEYGSGGISGGDLLPGGWWYTSPGGAGCSNDGDPDNMFGLEFPCGDVMTFSHCFELTARDIQNITDCSNPFDTDLSVKIFNLADGETGCYNDVTCSGDTPVTFTSSLDCSQLLDIYATDKTICSGQFTEIPISITPGFEAPVTIEVLDQGNTTGAQDWMFETGTGIIPDQITNLGTQTETIRYRASIENSSSVCTPPSIEFELTVLPPLDFEVTENTHTICTGDRKSFEAPDGFDTYQWIDPDGITVSTDREVILEKAGNYFVVVTQGICEAVEMITVTEVSLFSNGLITTDIEVCDDYVGTLPTSVDLTALQATGVQGIWYDQDDNVISEPSNVDFTGFLPGVLVYSFEVTNAPPPCPNITYNLNITIQDCECPSLEILPLPVLCAETNTLELTDYEITTEAGTWTIVDGPDVNSISLNGTELSITEASIEGDYTLSFRLNDISATPACDDEVMAVLSIIAPPSVQLIAVAAACNADTGDDPDVIDLDDLFISGSTGIWTTATGLTINPDNTVSFNGLNPGDYIFDYTTNDAQAPCQDVSSSITISVIDCTCPPVEIDEVGDFCQGVATFDLSTLILDGGPGSWSLESANTFNLPIIDNNNQTMTFTDITSIGEYELIFTLDNPVPTGCSNSASVTFTVFDAPFVILYTDIDACNGYNGNLEQVFNLNSLIQGGSGGGDWSTNHPELTIENNTTISFAGVAPGTYEIIYTTVDAVAPCVNISEIVTFDVRDCACPIVDVFQFPDLCIGSDTFDLNDYINTNAPGEWYINGIVGTNAIAIIDDHYMRYSEFAEPGLYELSYVLYNLGYDPDCELVGNTFFYIHENPYAQVIADTFVCNMDIGIGPDFLNMDSLVISGSDGDWVSWDTNLTVEADNEVSFTGMPAGDYWFTYTTNTAFVPCVDTFYEVKVEVRDCTCPALDLLFISPMCTTDGVINFVNYLDNPTGAPGIWTLDGPMGQLVDIQQVWLDTMMAGNYTLNFTWLNDPIGNCPDNASTNFIVYNSPYIEVEPEYSVCNEPGAIAPNCVDLTTFVNGSPGQWFAPADFTGDFTDLTNVCFDGIPDGTTFEFTYITNTAQQPCEDIEGRTTITVEDCTCPILNLFDPGPLCNDNEILDLQDLEVINIASGTWSIIDGPQNIALNGTVFESNDVSPGMYTLQYTLDETVDAHCEQFLQVELEVIESFNAGIGDDLSYCAFEDEMIDLNLILQGADAGGDWSDVSVVTSGIAFTTGGMLDVSQLSEGNYEFEYHFDNTEPCADQSSFISVLIYPNPIANATMPLELNCAQDMVMLDASSSTSGNDINLIWRDENGDQINTNNNPLTEVTEPGMYTLELLNTVSGCQDMAVYEVLEDTSTPYFDIAVNLPACDFSTNASINVIDVDGIQGVAQFSIDGGQTWTTSNQFSDLESGTYDIILEDERGCRYEEQGIVIDLIEPIGLELGQDRTVDYGENEFYTLEPEIQIDLDLIAYVIWEEDGVVIFEGSPQDFFTIDVDPFGVNTYCLTIMDIYGCEESDCVTLTEELDPEIYLPNIFNPSDYTINNTVFVQTGPYVITVNEFRIYDRWGNLVFEGETDHAPNDPSQGWKGFIKGQLAEEGIYVYFVRATDVLGQEQQLTGDVMVVK